MPKVSDEYREARRDEIAQAAIRCLERNGVRDTSIADIVAESGLSTGAIYSHFTNKAELARYIVGRFLGVRIDELEHRAAEGEVLSPREILLTMLGIFTSTGLSPGLVLQFWGEAMVDPEIRAEMTNTIGRLFSGLQAAILPWARAQTPDDAAAAALSARAARTVVTLAQGFIANTAMLGRREPAEYVEFAASVLSS
ncbi:TetR/AcrR family transcriptional regulator [Microbacterium sp. 4R-513]|uniref:TetR/AcrR family transcriptional regulator n=1 Tax=Microbacterium sp. 4R-513 TaxID=2567934 RepID=UPI0013E1F5C6|nr:TetR/AcrR family transcriptional regulator [Microbacterium sp. 4R-513]QIG38644.1 TetR/AcrR family transcriptional regulator [Microbacterium sp. 4R-513]